MDDPFVVSADLASTWGAIIEPFLGQRLLGIVDGMGCVELVFDGEGINLLTVYVDGRATHSKGFVANPRDYARVHRSPRPYGS